MTEQEIRTTLREAGGDLLALKPFGTGTIIHLWLARRELTIFVRGIEDLRKKLRELDQ